MTGAYDFMTEAAATYDVRRTDRRPPTDASASAIRRSGPVPYYAQLAEILREAIERGHWLPGDALPAEGDLCRFFSLSRTVVRQALNELVAEGLVVKEKGRGTFIARPKIAELVVHELRGFHDEMTERGHHVETEIYRQEIVPVPPHVAPALGVSMRSEVVHLARVRSVDGEPTVAVDTWLPLPRFAALAETDLADRSLYHVLVEEFGVFAQGGSRRVEAAVADADVAELLDIAPGEPLLVLSATTLDQDASPFEHFRASYRGDRTSFEITIGPAADAGGPFKESLP
jgi:GntR family transcriptional regulator